MFGGIAGSICFFNFLEIIGNSGHKLPANGSEKMGIYIITS